MRYQVVIQVDNVAEFEAFEDWLKKHQKEVIAISENSGCGCCVDIFTIDALKIVKPLAMFSLIETDQSVELHYGLEKNIFINDYLNYQKNKLG
jgi:hypothetical protein